MKLRKNIKIGKVNFLKLFIIAIFVFYNSSINALENSESFEGSFIEVKILDRYQRIIFEDVRSNDIIWDGIDKNTSGDAKKGFYYYEITPIEYGSTRTKSLVGVIFLDR